MEIWLRQEGVEYGPYTLAQVKEFVASGESVLEDEAWFDGCDDYVTVGDIPHFTSPRKVAFEEPTGPVKGESFSIPDVNLDMLWCKSGTFMMGSPEEEDSLKFGDDTQHEVTLTKGFFLGKYEVTQEQWERVTRASRSRENLDRGGGLLLGLWAKMMGSNPSLYKGATLPVEMVTWKKAMQFCGKLMQMEKAAGRLPEGWVYTLPTEAQWEYACRAGTTTRYPFGDTITPMQANYEENVFKTTPVGTYPPNAWGFHDMLGNVWEWCLDWYGKYPSGSVVDPVGPPSGLQRVVRGGSWNCLGRMMRSANRLKYWPDTRNNYLGFRLSLQKEKTE
jgi:formylglycine-generating enzyme